MKRIITGILIVIGIVITACGLYIKRQESVAISLIGGADGPTSVFVAGRIGGMSGNVMIAVGIVIMLVAAIIVTLYLKKK